MDQFQILTGNQLMSQISDITYDEMWSFGLTQIVMNVVEICHICGPVMV